MWLDDVVARTTIVSTWGNGVRNQLVQQFATTAERDSHAAALPDGMLAYVTGTDTLYQRRAALAGGWRTIAMPWTLYTPTVRVGGAVVAPADVSIDRRHYRRLGGTSIGVSITATMSSASAVGVGALGFSLPVQVPAGTPALTAVGSGRVQGGGVAGGGVFAQVAVTDPGNVALTLPGGYVTVNAPWSAWLELNYQGDDG